MRRLTALVLLAAAAALAVRARRPPVEPSQNGHVTHEGELAAVSRLMAQARAGARGRVDRLRGDL